jgi:hypothetical protein
LLYLFAFLVALILLDSATISLSGWIINATPQHMMSVLKGSGLIIGLSIALLIALPLFALVFRFIGMVVEEFLPSNARWEKFAKYAAYVLVYLNMIACVYFLATLYVSLNVWSVLELSVISLWLWSLNAYLRAKANAEVRATS